jgi:hypothetical protein
MAGFEIGVNATGLPELGGMTGRFIDELHGLVPEISMQAAKLVAEEAAPTVPVRSGKAAKSIQAYQTGGTAMVQGGQGLEYFAWLSYGGVSGRNLSNRRAEVAEGRYIYPAYERNFPRIQTLMEDELSALAKSIFRG